MIQYFMNIDIRNVEDATAVFDQFKKKIESNKDFDFSKEYDVEINYFNYDIVENSLDEEKPSEIQRYHYLFIKKMREFFSSIGIKINEFGLKGTLSELKEGVVSIDLIKSYYLDHRINTVIPCKELYNYEDNLKTLDKLLESNMISQQEYEENIDSLQKEMNIEIIEIENKYVN